VGIVDACLFGLKGHALSSLARHEEATDAYKEALKLGPEDPYVRHLVAASGALPGARRAPPEYLRTVFDGYADRFEAHLISLGYRMPGLIRTVMMEHPAVLAGKAVGPALDLGCGTGLAALAISDMPIGPITGVEISPRMLAQARAKQLYGELCEIDLVRFLAQTDQHWPLVLAADVFCYFGALDEAFAAVHARMEPAGWFIFSVETLVADHDGNVPGNGDWSLQRLGRYAHSTDYVIQSALRAGFRIRILRSEPVRFEAGVEVPGLLVVLERIRHDG
jgi:predicted TPR repeat methyltransferase